MANSSAKKLYKSNALRLNTLRQTIFFMNLMFAVRQLLNSQKFTVFYRVAWPILLAIYIAPYLFISSAAKATYSETGDLIDAGMDIGAGGILEYCHDLIYLTIFAQFGLMFTKWALLVFLAVPMYATYVYCASGASMSGGDGAEEEAEAENYAGMSRKDRRKAQREARKGR